MTRNVSENFELANTNDCSCSIFKKKISGGLFIICTVNRVLLIVKQTVQYTLTAKEFESSYVRLI